MSTASAEARAQCAARLRIIIWRDELNEGKVFLRDIIDLEATYAGPDESWRDEHGNTLRRGMPMAVSDAAAARLTRRPDVVVTAPTWHHQGGGCC